jgi:hypothetical protein
MIDDGRCPTCGRGQQLSHSIFDQGQTRIHWTMWSCGHSLRTVVASERPRMWSSLRRRTRVSVHA